MKKLLLLLFVTALFQVNAQYEVSNTVSTCHPGNQAEKCDRKFFLRH